MRPKWRSELSLPARSRNKHEYREGSNLKFIEPSFLWGIPLAGRLYVRKEVLPLEETPIADAVRVGTRRHEVLNHV